MKKLIVLSLLVCSSVLADPPIPTPIPMITHWVRNPDGNGITLGFQTVPGLVYTVQRTHNFEHWNTVSNFTATGYVYSMSFTTNDPRYVTQQFIRYKVEQPAH